MTPDASKEDPLKPLRPGYITYSGFPSYRKEMEELIEEIEEDRRQLNPAPPFPSLSSPPPIPISGFSKESRGILHKMKENETDQGHRRES